MPHVDGPTRMKLIEEYVRLKALGASDKQIARMFDVSDMTILRWKKQYLSGQDIPKATAPAGPVPPTGDSAYVRKLRELVSALLIENERLRAMVEAQGGDTLDRSA